MSGAVLGAAVGGSLGTVVLALIMILVYVLRKRDNHKIDEYGFSSDPVKDHHVDADPVKINENQYIAR